MRDIRGWTPLGVPGNPLLSMAIATYEQTDELACLLYSFKCQTYAHWEAVVVHDGPGPLGRAVVDHIGDPRIRWLDTPERREYYGHPWRTFGIDACRGDFIGLTNGDNYYAPVYFEWMLAKLAEYNADLVYCDWVHSHTQWQMMRAGPARRLIDLGCWIARADLVKSTPWTDFGFEGDGIFFEALLARSSRVVHLPRPLFVHN